MFAVMHHVMGAYEIAQRLGVSRQRVQQLVVRQDFPKPIRELAMGKVWDSDDVEAWIREHRPDIAEAPESPSEPVAEAPEPAPKPAAVEGAAAKPKRRTTRRPRKTAPPARPQD
jgi:predicted DNA-binding transcriptional regulator AlpA